MNTAHQFTIISPVVIRLPNGKFFSERKAGGVVSKRNSPTIDCQEWLDTYLAKAPAGSVAIPYAAA